MCYQYLIVDVSLHGFGVSMIDSDITLAALPEESLSRASVEAVADLGGVRGGGAKCLNGHSHCPPPQPLAQLPPMHCRPS